MTKRAYNNHMATAPRPTRLSVNMNDETASDLYQLARRRGVTYTETVRRIVSVARFLDDETDLGHTIQIVDHEANKVRELVIR